MYVNYFCIVQASYLAQIHQKLGWVIGLTGRGFWLHGNFAVIAMVVVVDEVVDSAGEAVVVAAAVEVVVAAASGADSEVRSMYDSW